LAASNKSILRPFLCVVFFAKNSGFHGKGFFSILLGELIRFFRSQGFALHDDVVSLDRKGKVPPWQHSSIVEVQTEFCGEEVFGLDEDGLWDCLSLKFLVASLPFELVERFVQTV
jgi:hypothetical protein